MKNPRANGSAAHLRKDAFLAAFLLTLSFLVVEGAITHGYDCSDALAKTVRLHPLEFKHITYNVTQTLGGFKFLDHGSAQLVFNELVNQGIFHLFILAGNIWRGQLWVAMDDGYVYHMKCVNKTVSEYHNNTCWEDPVVKDINGKMYFYDAKTQLLLRNSRQVPCTLEDVSPITKVARVIEKASVLRSGNKALSFALFGLQDMINEDSTRLFSKDSLTKLVDAEEYALDHWLGIFSIWIRRHMTKCAFVWLCITTIGGGIMVGYAIRSGVPKLKALSLIISWIKVFLDLKAAIQSSRGKLREPQLQLAARSNKNLVVPDGDDDIRNALFNAFMAIDCLLDRVEQLEQLQPADCRPAHRFQAPHNAGDKRRSLRSRI